MPRIFSKIHFLPSFILPLIIMPRIFSKIHFLPSFILPLIICLRYFQKIAKLLTLAMLGPLCKYFYLKMGHFQTCYKIIHFELLGVLKYEEIPPKMRKIMEIATFNSARILRLTYAPRSAAFIHLPFIVPIFQPQDIPRKQKLEKQIYV